MAPARSPWGDAIHTRLQLGPATLDQLVAHAAPLIPPGKAARVGERLRTRNRPTGAPTARVEGDDHQAISTGRRRLIRASVHSGLNRGTIRRLPDGRYTKAGE